MPFVELRQAYPTSNSLLGFALSLISLLGITLGMIVGLLVARIGARRVLLASLALGALLSLMQAALPPLPLLLLSRVLEGASHLGIVVAAPTLIGTLAPPAWKSVAMTLWGTFFGVAFALVAWIGLPLVNACGLGALFVAHGAITAMVGFLLLGLLPGDGRAASGASTGVATKGAGARDILDRHLTAYASPRVSAPAFGWLFYTFTFVALLTVLPQIVPATDRAFVAGSMPLASIAINMTLGVGLLRFFPAVTVVRIGFAIGAVVAILVIALPVSPVLCIALFGSLGLVQGASFAAIPQLNVMPGDQATANGAMAQMGNLGNIAGTPVLLAALAMGGTALVMGIVIGCYVVAIAIHTGLARRRQSG